MRNSFNLKDLKLKTATFWKQTNSQSQNPQVKRQLWIYGAKFVRGKKKIKKSREWRAENCGGQSPACLVKISLINFAKNRRSCKNNRTSPFAEPSLSAPAGLLAKWTGSFAMCAPFEMTKKWQNAMHNRLIWTWLAELGTFGIFEFFQW